MLGLGTSALPRAEAAGSVGEDQVGRPWTGPPGITETVAEIVARERGSGASGRSKREARPARGRPHGPRENPDSPEVTSNGPRTARPGVLAVPPDPGVSFLAVSSTESSYIPPDTMGSVGPTQILIHVNGRVKLFDKTGVLGAINVTDETFWNSVDDNEGVSDPHVEYDRLSGRWFLTAINTPDAGANRILIAVSSGSTITNTSSFTFFQFQHDQVGTTPNADSGLFADYPTLGVDGLAVYIGVNVFDSNSLEGTTGFVVRKDHLLSSTLTATAFRQIGNVTPPSGIYTPQAVHNQDPQATEGYFIGVDMLEFGKLVLRRVSNPGGTPSISGNLPVTVPLTTFPIDVPQPSGPLMDGIDDRLFAAMIALGPTGQPTLWTAHNIQVNGSGIANDTGGRNGSRWYQIGNLTATPTLIQSGTLFDSAPTTPYSYWMPSIAASGQGHAVLGASRASASAGNGGYASVAVAERLATDTLGTLSAPLLAQSSSSSYDIPWFPDTERWGDYSQTVVDPTDNMTFWTFQEYASATNTWGVRVIQLEAPPPATPSSASPAKIPDEDPSVTVEVTGTSADGSGFFDPGPDTGGPGFANQIAATVDGGVTVNSVIYTDPTHVTLDLSTVGATTGLRSLTVTNPDGQSVMVPSFLTVSADPPRTLTVVTDGTGTVTATGISCPGDCGEEYVHGVMVNLTATADPGSSFTGWGGNCSGTSSTCSLTMDSDKSVTATFQLLPILTVSKDGNGGGTVTSTPPGISCGVDCEQYYENATSVTLTAAPDMNSRFGAWTGCDSTSGNQCTVAVSSNRLVTATLVGTRALTLTRAGTGSGLVTSAPGGIACGSACTASFDVGTAVTLTAASDAGSGFRSWSGCDSVSGNQCTVTMTAARAVTASLLGPGDDVVQLEGDEGTISTFGGNDTIHLNVPPGMTGLSLMIGAGDGNDVVRISIPPTSCVSVTVVGGTGNDRIEVGNLPTGCSLTVNAGSGNDVIKGGVSSGGPGMRGRLLVDAGPGRDTARGAAGRDRLRGRGGRDTLIGAGGADLLVGGPGFDICNSGAGRDRLRSCEREI